MEVLVERESRVTALVSVPNPRIFTHRSCCNLSLSRGMLRLPVESLSGVYGARVSFFGVKCRLQKRNTLCTRLVLPPSIKTEWPD
jgi:hypothetical protein